MSLRLRVMQRDGWPRPIPPHRGPWLWDCMPDTILHLSVGDNQTLQLPPQHTPYKTSQIDVAHWCAVCQIHGLSNTPPTHKQWWVRDSAWNGGKRHTHTHIHALTSYWNGSLNPVPNDEHFFFLSVVPSFSPGSPSLALLTSLTCHDQMGAFRVQCLTWTPGGCHSITSPSSDLHSFITSSLHHPSITLLPFLHQQILPFLFHSERILFRSVATPQLHPRCCERYVNW